jgi:hypothetical protein
VIMKRPFSERRVRPGDNIGNSQSGVGSITLVIARDGRAGSALTLRAWAGPREDPAVCALTGSRNLGEPTARRGWRKATPRGRMAGAKAVDYRQG